MRIALFGVAMLAAALAWPRAAAALSAADIFQKHGLLGTWAVSCQDPTTEANPHVVYRLVDGDRVQRQTSFEPGNVVDLSTIDWAFEAGASELIVTWRTGDGDITNRILLGEGWMQVLESTRSDGLKLVVKGRMVRDNEAAPRFQRCSRGQSAGLRADRIGA